MIKNNVSTDAQNVQTELAMLRWEIEQHRELEKEVGDVCAFLAQALEPECLGDCDFVKLDDQGRKGLARILTRYQGLLTIAGYEDTNSPFVHPMHPGQCASNPHLAQQ